MPSEFAIPNGGAFGHRIVATVIYTPPLPPPAIEQPASSEVSYGIVSGRVAAGTRGVTVRVDGRVAASRLVRGRHFTLRVRLPSGDLSVRVVAWAADGRRSATTVRGVYGLPAAARPRLVADREDAVLARRVRRLGREFRTTSGLYVCSLTGGTGAAWNARTRFPAASTLKLAIAVSVLARYQGNVPPGSSVGRLLASTLEHSDNDAANALEVWLGGSTSGGSAYIDTLMRSIGMTDSEMYGGYEARALAGRIPVRVDDDLGFGFGKYTSAADLARLLRAVWLASGGLGPLVREQPGFTASDGRYLLWLLAHVQDVPKLERVERGNRGVTVLHKAGWIEAVRHDAGLVFWPGGVFVASVMTWNPYGTGISSDVLAGRVAAVALGRLRSREG